MAQSEYDCELAPSSGRALCAIAPSAQRPWTVVRVVVAVVLIAAGLLKAHAFISGSAADTGFPGPAWTLVAFAEFELLLGVWLLTGIFPGQARAVALTAFVAFLAVSLSRALSRQSSCGCLGDITVSPWYTAFFDVLVCAALWHWRPLSEVEVASHGSGVLSTIVGAAIALLTVASIVAMVQYAPASLDENGDIKGNNTVVMLEPETWLGRRFPLTKHTDIGESLSFGNWLVLLYRRDCPACRDEIERLSQVARDIASWHDSTRIAFIEVDQSPLNSVAMRPRPSYDRKLWMNA